MGEDTLGLGIDISKRRADVCLKRSGIPIETFVVSNDQNGISTLLKMIGPYARLFKIRAA